MLKIFSGMLCFLLSACMMVGPNYKEPKKQVAKHWVKKGPSVKEKPFKEARWWHTFHDSNLNALIAQSYSNNYSLQAAGVRVLQARAQLAQTVGMLYPQQQQAQGNLTYNRIGGTSLAGLVPSNFTTALLGFSATWEVDFWGKYRRAVQAKDAAFLGSLAAYDNALVSLFADVANTYVQIRTIEEQIRITKANIEVQTMGFNLAKARFRAGQTSLVDVEQAQTELAQTEARLPSFTNQLQLQKNALAVLLGTLPEEIDALIKPYQGIPKAPKRVNIGIPKEALARRPDVQQARLEAVAQSANIGVLAANLYPALSLNGTFAYTANTIGNNSLSDLFQWSNHMVSAGPGFTWNLLNYGQLTNAVRAQDAAFQASLFNYLNLVLKAQQEVQDQISAYVEAKKTTAALMKANSSATKSLKLALIRYKEGETDFTPVLNAEQQQLQVQTSLVSAQGNIPQAVVGLYRALGGGWMVRQGNDVVADTVKKEMAARTGWGTLLKPQNHFPAQTRKQKLKELYLPKW